MIVHWHTSDITDLSCCDGYGHIVNHNTGIIEKCPKCNGKVLTNEEVKKNRERVLRWLDGFTFWRWQVFCVQELAGSL